MVELETSNLIKIIIGVAVLVTIVVGAVFFFKDYVIDFFKNSFGGEEITLILGLIG